MYQNNLGKPYNEVLELKKTCPLWFSNNFFSNTLVNENDRMNEWLRIRILGKALIEKYSWAIPDTRALNILKSFSPLIELGCGKGYWSSLLKTMNVDIVAYDNDKNIKDTFTIVNIGDEKVLKQKNNKNRKILEKSSSKFLVNKNNFIRRFFQNKILWKVK